MKHPIVVNLLSFLALYLLSKAQASHFRHAILTWAPVNSYSNTLILRFRMAFRRSFSPSYNCDQSIINSGALRGSGGSWIARCRNSYCSSRTIADTGFQCTDFSVDEDWTMGEKNFTYTFASVSKEWVVSYQGCCWISSLVKYPDGNWLVTTTINLTRRSDTGRINSSPVSKSPAIIRFKEGCPQSFRIPVEDPDDDVVRCRWATYSESSRHTDSFPHGVIDERACLLQYNARRSGTAGTYAVALTLEDFPVGTTDFNSTTPFSAVGLQFLVIISARSGSCADVPLFTKATPTDGECTEVQIGLAYRAVIEVTLQDPSRRVTKIVTSSPVGMQLTPLRYDVSRGIFSRNITWYPSQYQVGQQLYCFKAVDSAGSESEWRCITILVGLSNTPRVVLGTRWPRYPSSQLGTGLMRLSIQFDRVIKKPRTSAYIRLVLLPSEHTVYKVDTLSRNVVISANKTELLFTLPKAALSMKGSYAILIDRGAVVGSGCSFDGPPTPGISSSQGWRFNVGGICSSGYYLDPPYYRTCTDVNECGSQSRKKRFAWWWPVTSIISIPFNSAFSAIATTTPAFSQVSTSTPGVSASAMIQLPPPGCSNHSYLEDSERRQGFYNGYDGYYQCDNNLAFGWYRFRGAAGTQMPTKCVGRNRCSTHAPGWLNASHPSVEDGIVTAKVCFHWTSGCCTWSTNIRVLNCGGFYVYELRPPPGCHLRYCGNGGSNQSTTTSSPQTSPTPAFYPAPTSTPGSCRYNLVNPQGNFTSPNYPSRYPHNLNCLWTITAAPGYYIDLHFINFVVEGCPYDYVEVFDQNYPSTSIKVKSCGYRGAWCVTSTSKVLYVRFVTDRSVALSGFFASYRNDANPFSGRCTSLRATQIQATQRSSPIAMPISALHPTSSSTTGVPASASLPFPSGLCGYNFTARQGNLTSPNYPYSYPNNLNCLWTITTTPGNYIYLYFTYFYVQGYYYGYHGQYGYNSYCPYDYVEIFDLVYPLTSIKIKGCGYQSPWCVKSKSHVMHVRFVTDSFSSYRGFTAHYRVYTNPPAGGNCLSLNPYASSSGILQATPSMYTNTKYAFSNSTSTPVGIIYPTPASKRLPHYSSTVSQEKVPDFHLQLPADCEQVCHNTPGSYICSCVSGYQIASDGKSCSDINECSVNNGGCSHHCYNIPGAHYCGCPNGTTMTANNLTCVQPGVAVTCGKRNMTISLEKQSFSFVRAEEVHLRYSSCKATENGTHVTISTLLNDCGTSVNETQDALLFWNELRVDAMIIDGVITRSHDIRLPFYCSYSRKKLLSLSFNPLGVYYGQEAGYGNFTFKMDFFKSGSFLVPYSTADYPLQLRLNDYIYVRYSVESSADLVIMAENCRATKDGSFYSLPQYKIIQNGCGRDTTMVYSYNSNRPYQEFRMKVFRFFNDYNAVYLHCELLACHRSSRNSRCQRGCLPGNRRKRRAVSRDGTEHLESTTKNTVSRGPLIFKDEVKQGGQGKKVGTLIGGVAGVGGVCILAFAALGILFVKYRLARRLMNRNKVGDLYATQNEMGRKGAYIQEDDINSKEDSL
ncbi:uncharacterized protein LOC141880862 isoform X6 [Acropora palmata]|uniref:uncharacterized protein LOC141880862 isoform X6 n=1 Tax=Acropora palmata TaxID=6131 RepID=UPI003DA16864